MPRNVAADVTGVASGGAGLVAPVRYAPVAGPSGSAQSQQTSSGRGEDQQHREQAEGDPRRQQQRGDQRAAAPAAARPRVPARAARRSAQERGQGRVVAFEVGAQGAQDRIVVHRGPLGVRAGRSVGCPPPCRQSVLPPAPGAEDAASRFPRCREPAAAGSRTVTVDQERGPALDRRADRQQRDHQADEGRGDVQDVVRGVDVEEVPVLADGDEAVDEQRRRTGRRAASRRCGHRPACGPAAARRRRRGCGRCCAAG